MTLQPQYSLLVREIESEIVPASLDAKIGLLPWKPRNKQERTWKILEVVGEIAKAHRISQAQVSLAWLEAQPAVTSVITRTVRVALANVTAQ